MTTIQWLRFGRWPSRHDIDLVLDADGQTYTDIERLLSASMPPHPLVDPDNCAPVPMKREDLPLSASLIDQAIRLGETYQLPLDVFLVPNADGSDFTIAAWAEPPFDVWEIGWSATFDPRNFFAGAEAVPDEL